MTKSMFRYEGTLTIGMAGQAGYELVEYLPARKVEG
jgi:hypothetical protein